MTTDNWTTTWLQSWHDSCMDYKVMGGRGDCLVITIAGASKVHKKVYAKGLNWGHISA